jgi:hypothetical protein
MFDDLLIVVWPAGTVRVRVLKYAALHSAFAALVLTFWKVVLL